MRVVVEPVPISRDPLVTVKRHLIASKYVALSPNLHIPLPVPVRVPLPLNRTVVASFHIHQIKFTDAALAYPRAELLRKYEVFLTFTLYQ